MELQSKFSSVRMGSNKSNKQLSELENIMNFYKSREEAAYDLQHGKGLKILTLK